MKKLHLAPRTNDGILCASDGEIASLLLAFQSIPSLQKRMRVLDLAKSLAASHTLLSPLTTCQTAEGETVAVERRKQCVAVVDQQ